MEMIWIFMTFVGRFPGEDFFGIKFQLFHVSNSENAFFSDLGGTPYYAGTPFIECTWVASGHLTRLHLKPAMDLSVSLSYE